MDKTPNPDATFVVARADDGAPLSSLVRRETHTAWAAAKRLITTGKVQLDGAVVTDPGQRVKKGQTVAVVSRAPRADVTHGLPREAIVYLDPHLVVVNKPAGVSTVPYEEGERGTLVDRVRVALHRQGAGGGDAPLFVVHRLDKETSGLIVFARTWLAKRHLAALFRDHDIERVYLALANGHVRADRVTYDTHLVENRGDGLRGSAKQRGIGVRAVTHVEVIARLPGNATLVRCRLETGRTHQIRIHLAEAMHPIVGERVYTRRFPLPLIEAPRLMLHAATLGFRHPARERESEPLRFAVDPPEDFRAMLGALGG